MPIDDEFDDDRPLGGGPLPPEDRLWRHPSEIAGGGIAASGLGRGAPASGAQPTRSRLVGRGALAAACLTGAVLAVGAMWLARPTRVVEHTITVTRTATTSSAVGLSLSPGSAEQLAKQVATELVPIRALRHGVWTNGSAIWLPGAGSLAVAAPLVTDASQILVVQDDGTSRPAHVAGVDAATGIAALRTYATSDSTNHTLTMSTVSPENGGACAVVGAPTSSESSGRQATVAAVVIRSASQRASVGGLLLQDSIQLDRALPADAVGGALVDGQGRLVGLVLGNSTDGGVATAAPAATIAAVANDLLEDGTVRRAWIGVWSTDLDPDAEAALAVPGARLTKVTPDGPAEKAGLRVGDIITDIDGVRVDDASDLVVQLRAHDPGDTIAVTVTSLTGRSVHQVLLGG